MVPKSFQLSCLYSTCYTPKAVGPLYVVIGMWVTLIKSILDSVWDPSSNIWRHGGVTSSLIGVPLMVVFLCVYSRIGFQSLGHLATERPYYLIVLVRSERLELSWARPTRPSTVPVYQFQHDRMLCGRLNE